MKIAGHHENASPNNKKRTTGDTGDKGFFAVDVRCFTHACTDVNRAAAYLVMACGTGFDHITTAWSVNAIEARTGISRTRAKAAIDGLIKDRLVSRVKGTKSRYKLATWAQFIVDPRPLTKAQTGTLDIIREGGSLTAKQTQISRDLERLGHVRWVDNVRAVFEPPAPELAFIPKTFVTGANGETPPAELLRQRRDVGLFRLVVDLYHGHNLADDGGIAKTALSRSYERSIEAEIGPYKILKFTLLQGHTTANPSHPIVAPHCPKKPDGTRDGSQLWTRLKALEDAGLIEWIPTLFEASDPLAEPLFPLGSGGSNSLDDRLGSLAHTAAASLISRLRNLDHIPPSLERTGETLLVPLPKAYDRATIVGIARLRYRPHTRRTSEWLAKIEKRSAELREKWAKIAKDFVHAKREAA